MPSPFPGVDPYIEDRGGWGDFHNSFLTCCRDALNDGLPENYVAKMEEHVRLVHAAGDRSSPRRPDLGVFREPGTVSSGGGGSGALLLEPVTIPLQVEEVDSIRETWIEVVRPPELGLVTVIEVLSPTNKSGPGREEYLDTRLRLIEQAVHIVEFDFLVRGRPLPMARLMPQGTRACNRLEVGDEARRPGLFLDDPRPDADDPNPPGRARYINGSTWPDPTPPPITAVVTADSSATWSP